MMKFTKSLVLREICDLLDRIIRPEVITIGLLRYGAHLPHLYDAAIQQAKGISLLLSHMLDFMPRDYFRDREILLLDDTVYLGREMKKYREQLVRDYGVDEKRITTAAVIAHNRSHFSPKEGGRRCSDVDYIVWKEELARLVQRTQRPTDRDHPLYYFSLPATTLAQLITILRSIGPVYSICSDASGATLRLVLPLSMTDVYQTCDIPGFVPSGIPKIRFYCRVSQGAANMTAVPMVFGTLDLDRFLARGAELLAMRLHLPATFFVDIQRSDIIDKERMIFYFVSRGIAALVLRDFLESAFLPRLRNRLQSVTPEKRDRRFKYLFPAAYEAFHAAVFAEYERVIIAHQVSPTAAQTSFSEFLPVSAWETGTTGHDEALPSRLLSFVADRCNPVAWTGEAWEPTDTGDVVLHSDLFESMGPSDDVSRALDELLDCGLLRARDVRLKDHPNRYCRAYMCGGEYKAIEVSRIRDAYATGDTTDYEQLAAEERRDLRGSLYFR